MAYTRSVEDIVRLYSERESSRDPVVRRMAEIQAMYNGEIVVPLPELDKGEKPAVANLLQQGIDNYGARISSVMPMLTVPPVDARSKRAQDKAALRRKATLGWWERNRIDVQLKRRARQLVGYACSPVVIRPDFTNDEKTGGIAKWEPRNPLSAFPASSSDPDDLTPCDAIFSTSRTYGEIKRRWPDGAAAIWHEDIKDAERFTVLEYMDDEQWTYVLLNRSNNQYGTRDYVPHILLDTVINRIGLCPAVIPGRVTLDRPLGQLDGIVGMYQMQAKLMALNVHAVQKGIFPDMYVISQPNEEAKFISGPHPGYTGRVNIIEGGTVHYESPNPGFMTTQTIDRIERNMRVDSGISSEFGGESPTNIRTGRRGDQVISAQVDFRVQEAQDMLAASMQEENRRATKIVRTYFGSQPKSFYVNWPRGKGQVDYVPDRDFDSDYTSVNYSMPGADVQNLTIGLGQMTGLGLMSQKTSREMHPWIQDPNLEGDLVVSEGLERSLLQSLEAQATQGALPPADLARIAYLVRVEDKELAEAVEQVHKEAQQRQAAVDAQGQPTAVDPNSPEAQAGIAQPGAGAEAGAAIPAPTTDMSRLEQMLMQMRGTSAGAGAA